MGHKILVNDLVEILEGSYAGYYGYVTSYDAQFERPYEVQVTTDWGEHFEFFRAEQLSDEV